MITESIKNLLEERKNDKWRLQELETDNKKLREQLDAANYVIQTLNRVIAGDVE